MKRILLLIVILLTSLAFCHAQVPRRISYQGLLTTTGGGSATDGDYGITFDLYDAASNGAHLWGETQNAVVVSKGAFHVLLGSVTPLNLPFDKTYYVEMTIVSGPGVSGPVTIAPRAELTSSPYAVRSDSALYALSSGNVVDGSLTAADIADNQVVKSINGIRDQVYVRGDGGATVTSSGDSLIITAGSGGGGTGIQGVQNTDNTLDILNPNGPTATINVKNGGIASGQLAIDAASLARVSGGVMTSAAGRVGIGTVTPSVPLHVFGTESRLRLESSQDNVWTTTEYKANAREWHTGVGGSNVNNDVKSKFYLYDATAAQFRLVVDQNGRVGIGTTSPEDVLHVANHIRIGKDPSFPAVYGELKHDGGSSGFVINANAGGSWADMLFQTDGNTRMFIESQGSVGIGTTSPVGKLDVEAGAGPALYAVNSGATRTNATLRLENTNLTSGMCAYAHNTSTFATAHFQNDSTGQVLWLQRSQAGNFIVAYNNGYKFWVDDVGETHTESLEILGGADLSERFEVENGGSPIEPGSVVCIDPDHEGQLLVSRQAYDRRVAGIVSGAGNIKPGMVMGQSGSVASGAHPVALTGRVYCKAEATSSSIEVGDLLTTSSIPGYAMKAADPGRSQGAIIGKAMSRLGSGKGLILVLVTLQ